MGGGYLPAQRQQKELSGGVDSTSSERMELLAAVSALRTLKGISYEGQRVVINTDSRYLTDGAEKGFGSRPTPAKPLCPMKICGRSCPGLRPSTPSTGSG